MTKIKKSIEEGIMFLNKKQKKNGGFQSVSSRNKNFSSVFRVDSIFQTCLILLCISCLRNNQKSKEMLNKGLNYLISQKGDHWSFNYWERGGKEFKAIPYPDDMDDTSCALSFFMLAKPPLVTGEVLAKFVSMLTAVESEEGGPYGTWLVNKEAKEHWKDMDLAVNANIGYFLSLHGIFLPKINKLIKNSINENNYKSPYYANEFIVIYFISRWYKQKDKEKIIKFLLSKKNKNGSWGSALNTALAVTSLCNFSYKGDLSSSIKYLISQQQQGCWQAHPLVVEIARRNGQVYSGSQHLTTAFCVEALQKYHTNVNTLRNKQKKEDGLSKIHKAIVANVSKIFIKNKSISKKAFLLMDRIFKNDSSRQITLLPYLFFKSLKNKNMEESFAIKLCEANLLGWIAYTIYDDFFDDEGKKEFLSLANICLRQASVILSSDSFSKDFSDIFKNTMDKIDFANETEVTKYRIENKAGILNIKNLPEYENLFLLAERSFGHVLGPIALFGESGFKGNSSEMENLKDFFTSYIIARQLNDDAHDWKQDLEKGHISYINTLLINKFKLKTKKKQINLKEDINILENIFWNEIVVLNCKIIMQQTKKAKKSARKLKHLVEDRFFEELIISIEKSTKSTLLQHKEMKQFLRVYEK